MSEPIESPTLAKKIASGWTGQAEPPPQTVERAQQKIQGTIRGVTLGTIISLFCLALAWRAFEVSFVGLSILALCLVGAVFAGGIMDKDTLVKLAEIARGKKEPEA